MARPIVFFSYAHEDEELMNDVRRQLVVYERRGEIEKVYDRMIPLGGRWNGWIDDFIRRAEIILLLVSPHFIESEYCYEIEMRVALERHNMGEAKVIPVILRPCAWQETPFGTLQALPTDGRPVTSWPDRYEVCLNIAQGVMGVVRGLPA